MAATVSRNTRGRADVVSQGAFAGMSRRAFLAKAAGAGAAAVLTDWAAPVIEKAYGAGPCSGHLTDIEHIVLCLQENRSFDHYFGTLSAVDGFDTPTPLFQQRAGTRRRRRWTPPALRCPTASIPPGVPTGLASASTTQTTSGLPRTCHGTAAPMTAGCRRRRGPGRWPTRPW